MHDRIEARIKDLDAELQAGGTRLRELDCERLHLRETLLRIEGAKLALNELLHSERPVVSVSRTGRAAPEVIDDGTVSGSEEAA